MISRVNIHKEKALREFYLPKVALDSEGVLTFSTRYLSVFEGRFVRDYLSINVNDYVDDTLFKLDTESPDENVIQPEYFAYCLRTLINSRTAFYECEKNVEEAFEKLIPDLNYGFIKRQNGFFISCRPLTKEEVFLTSVIV